MSNISRRNLFGTAAAASGFVSTTTVADTFAEPPQPPFGPAPTPLAGPR